MVRGGRGPRRPCSATVARVCPAPLVPQRQRPVPRTPQRPRPSQRWAGTITRRPSRCWAGRDSPIVWRVRRGMPSTPSTRPLSATNRPGSAGARSCCPPASTMRLGPCGAAAQSTSSALSRPSSLDGVPMSRSFFPLLSQFDLASTASPISPSSTATGSARYSSRPGSSATGGRQEESFDL